MLVLAIAATIYFFRLGRAGFDDAEAYSAYIASRTSVAAVYNASLQLDPGKGGGLYVFLLHWYCEVFGTGEAALRAFSAAFALASVILVYALAEDLFGAEIALLAAALWAFNPIALIVARWARMYSMFITLTLASLSTLYRYVSLAQALKSSVASMLVLMDLAGRHPFSTLVDALRLIDDTADTALYGLTPEVARYILSHIDESVATATTVTCTAMTKTGG